MNSIRKPLIAALALTAALSAPLAFAQSPAASPTGDAAAPATSAQPTGAESAATAAPQKKSWADVDGDKDGNLSKNEASAVPALSQVFDQADADANGQLTPDEYKNYVAKVQSSGGGKSGR